MKKVIVVGCAGAGQKIAIEKALIAENKKPVFVNSVGEIPEDINTEVMKADEIITEAIKLNRLAEIPKSCMMELNKPKVKGHQRPYKYHR